MKRKAGGITGGTFDFKPQQILIVTTAPAGADDYAVTELALPIPRVGTPVKGKSVIIEILKVSYTRDATDDADVTGSFWCFLSTNTARTQSETSDAASLRIDMTSSQAFAFSRRRWLTTTSGSVMEPLTWAYDMTDGNGNGYLIATDKLFLVTGSAGTGPSSTRCEILYRFFGASLEEYIGIVQSQS